MNTKETVELLESLKLGDMIEVVTPFKSFNHVGGEKMCWVLDEMEELVEGEVEYLFSVYWYDIRVADVSIFIIREAGLVTLNGDIWEGGVA